MASDNGRVRREAEARHDPERARIGEARTRGVPWRRWGPYLSERSWGTVREDYSPFGTAWDYFPHDHARSRAYRWGEDGLLGISDDGGRLCFALALWNGADPILKERLFGLTGQEGNHGEDVKECYYYLDSTPTHSYMRALYRYPQRAFPYADLVAENRRRGRDAPEYELLDTGIFADDRYFDVVAEYAKASADDVLIRLKATNRGPDPATLRLLPTLWFRNTWSWGRDPNRPELRRLRSTALPGDLPLIRAVCQALGEYWFTCDGHPALLFTENDTNTERLWGWRGGSPYVKDSIDAAVVHGRADAVNPEPVGTKLALDYRLDLAPGETATVRLRLAGTLPREPFADFNAVFERRQTEADRFYEAFGAAGLSADERLIQRQAFAGVLWTKQFYHFDIREWQDGDPGHPPPPPERRWGRNCEWRHIDCHDVLSMPDKWEYPWFAAWDLAFHCVPLARVDPDFAKEQLLLLGREWYQHPNGQLPAYEWAFGDVNPPVHAWAALRVYEIERDEWGRADVDFLERVFHKLLLNFSWWVNRKDAEGRNLYQGGFLGMDNIGLFDRSAALPTGGHLEQSDGTAWMGMYCLSMLQIALELTRERQAFEDVATKFFEHFLYIANALNNVGDHGIALWDEADGFYYDVLNLPDGREVLLKVRSLVGLIPLLAVETIDPSALVAAPDFKLRLEWFLANRPELAALVSRWQEPGQGERRLLALTRGHRLKALLRRMLDPNEFLSDYGVRSVSRYHAEHPYTLDLGGTTRTVAYDPAESHEAIFGGNSNWRGPIWFPINYLLIDALDRFHHYYGDDFTVECPTGSGSRLTLHGVALVLGERLERIFRRDPDGRRPVFGAFDLLQRDPHWRDLILFSEYFHGDTGAGLGASHQTGWTALIAELLLRRGRRQAATTRAGVTPAPTAETEVTMESFSRDAVTGLAARAVPGTEVPGAPLDPTMGFGAGVWPIDHRAIASGRQRKEHRCPSRSRCTARSGVATASAPRSSSGSSVSTTSSWTLTRIGRGWPSSSR